MRKATSNSWVRMVLAFMAVLLVAGPGMVLAGHDPSYIPKTSLLMGPSTVAPGGSAAFVLRVTFTNGRTSDFPSDTGASFSAVNGTISTTGAYTNTAGPKDKISGSFSLNGVTVTSAKVIYIK